jgi:hypothetical protein
MSNLLRHGIWVSFTDQCGRHSGIIEQIESITRTTFKVVWKGERITFHRFAQCSGWDFAVKDWNT